MIDDTNPIEIRHTIAYLKYFIPSVNRTIVHETFNRNIGLLHLKVTGG